MITSNAPIIPAITQRESDTELLDWLQSQIVDVIYLDDGRIIDVRGDCVRSAIGRAMKAPVTAQ